MPKTISIDLPRVRHQTRRTPTTLTEAEADDLRYLWGGYGTDVGIRSPHGALEMKLLLAPPRNVSSPILDELERQAGRCCEGRLIRLVVLEGWGVASEIRRALRKLIAVSRLERWSFDTPVVPDNPIDRTHAQQQRLADYTGYEIRVRAKGDVKMRLALGRVPLTREERWQRQDDALESECLMMAVKAPPPSARADGDYVGTLQSARLDRTRLRLGRIARAHVDILQLTYGVGYMSDDDAAERLRFRFGGSREKSATAIEAACRAYREAQ